MSRDAYGNTTVSNKYGATTAMTPGGYQSAYGGVPGGGLPGIDGPDDARESRTSGGLLGGPSLGGHFGSKNNRTPAEKKALAATLGLAMAGGAVAGPVGALAGALLGKGMAPGGLLSKVNAIDTSKIGTITLGNQAFSFGPTTNFAKPNYGLNSFPSAPSGGYKGGANFTRNSAEGMRSISPGAAAAIGRGEGGLY